MNRLARAGTLAFFAAAGSAGAQDFADCSLALAFALDISVSVDDAEYRMQCKYQVVLFGRQLLREPNSGILIR